jgi:aspartate kinase
LFYNFVLIFMQVFKFGGASVKDAASVKNVAALLKRYANESTIVVISAMDKTTNVLEALTKAYFYKEGDIDSIFKSLQSFHINMAEVLLKENKHQLLNELANVFVELQWILEEEPDYTYNFHYDQIVSQGEILATKIVAAYLNEQGLINKWIDARGIIQTDNTYREAKVDYELTEELVQNQLLPLFKEQNLLITQGFIGGTSENFTTTLGREGSDYTAALLAYFANANQVIIWKDVSGVLNADPKYFKNTNRIDELSYHDAIELAYFGASILHPKTIKPLENKKIPLYVKSFLDPESPGTLIFASNTRVSVPSYIFKTEQILISIEPRDFSFIAEENISLIFAALSKHNVHVNMMHNSAISFSICIDHDKNKTNAFIDDLKTQFRILFNENVQLMTIRNYNQEIITKLTGDKVILLEQRSRNTHQMVLR